MQLLSTDDIIPRSLWLNWVASLQSASGGKQNKHLLFDRRCVHPIQLNWRFASEMLGDCKATWWCWRRLQRSLGGRKASSSLPKHLSGQEVTCSAIPFAPLVALVACKRTITYFVRKRPFCAKPIHQNTMFARLPTSEPLEQSHIISIIWIHLNHLRKIVQLRTWQVLVFNFIPGCQSIADLCRDFERTHPCGRSLGNGDLSCLSHDPAALTAKQLRCQTVSCFLLGTQSAWRWSGGFGEVNDVWRLAQFFFIWRRPVQVNCEHFRALRALVRQAASLGRHRDMSGESHGGRLPRTCLKTHHNATAFCGLEALPGVTW